MRAAARASEVRIERAGGEALRTGGRLGPYEILAQLGVGGMGEVYRARDPRLGRDVAVKVLPREYAESPDRLRRFQQEARAAGALDHPNLLAIHDAGTHEGLPYVVFELLEGDTLRSRLQGGALPARRAVDYALQVARGLAAAHEKGIVHRDLKPDNLFLTKDGRVKILDFGLAKFTRPEQAGEASSLTESGAVLGTAAYMSPEQVRAQPADHRSDIFSLGVILYEMVAGHRPFRGGSAAETMSAILKEEPAEPAEIGTKIPPELYQITARCLEKDPEQRFQSAGDLAFALSVLSTPSEAWQTSRARGLRQVRERPEEVQPRSVFVGREREMAALRAGLDSALAGQGRIFLIGGEPGIGKSRLAEEIAACAREQGARVLWGRCWEAGGAPAFWPWVHSLRAYVRDLDGDALRAQLGADGAAHVSQILPEVRDRLPGLRAPTSLDPAEARFRLFDAVAGFLRNASKAQPLLLVLDDLHAADAPSLLLFQFLARELEGCRGLLLGAYRHTELRRDHPLSAALADLTRQPGTQHLLLGGLSPTDVSRFIELAAGFPPPEALVAAVHAQSDGNPLFIGEVVRLLAHEGRLRQAGEEPSRLILPPGVREVIAQRLAHLSRECYDILSLASVLGREFRLDVLERLSERPAPRLLCVLEEAEAARVIGEAPGTLGRLRFSHALVRDALYDDLAATVRVRLHRQAGEALEALSAGDPEPHLTELAHHFFQAAPGGEAKRAVEYARAAGDHAAQLLASEEAVRLYKMALDAERLQSSPDEVLLCDLLLALGDAQARAGDLGAAKETFLRAAEVARRLALGEQLARAALGYGGRFVWERAAGDPHVIPLLRDALAAQGERETTGRVRLLARLAGALRDEADRRPRDALSGEAVELARRVGDLAALAYALDGRYAAIWWPENPEDRLGIATELVRVAAEAGEQERLLQGHHYRLIALLELGDMPGVYWELEAKARLVEALRQPAQRWYLDVIRAKLALFEGRLEEARDLISRALRIGQRAQSFDAVVSYRMQTYLLRLLQGGLEEIEGTIRRSVEEYPMYPMFRCMLAHLYAEIGRPAEAREVFEPFAAADFADLPEDNEWLLGMTLLAEVVEVLRDVPRARALYERLLPFARLNVVAPAEVALGSAARSLGILAGVLRRWDRAEAHLVEAIERNERMGARPWVARSQHDCARMLLARDAAGDRKRAEDLLRRALLNAREIGMAPLVLRIEALLGPAPREGKVLQFPSAAVARRHTFRREGETWAVAFEGESFRLRDTKGLRYLARLLGRPGEELHALDLVTEEKGSPDLGDAGEILDAEAKAAYRRRLAELEAEVEEATAWDDPARATRAREEMDFLARELARAIGLGGRDRRAASAAERARVNATRAIKSALLRVREHSPALWRHLSATVRTGSYCSYQPDPRVPIAWDV